MNPFSAIHRYVIENGGLFTAMSKVARLSRMLLQKYGVGALIAEIGNTLRVRNAQVARLNRRNALLKAASTKSFRILATPHTMYVAHMLEHALTAAGYSVVITTSLPILRFEDAVFIVICPQMFSKLPRFMISYQMEQSVSPRWFTPKYLKTLRNSLAIFDYSKKNVDFLREQGIPYTNIFYLPITQIPNYRKFLEVRGWKLPVESTKSCDVLFYGDPHNLRRINMLSELDQRFNVRVIDNIFGVDLYCALLSARVIINLHYYDNALLETTRIHECLSLGLTVVSESSPDCEDYPDLFGRVHFVESGDVSQMSDAIQQILNQQHQGKALPESTSHQNTSIFSVNRFLLANDLMNFDTFANNQHYAPDLSTGKVCLSLPETSERRNAFISQGFTEFRIFDGVRHAQSWLGCAMSYKYLIFCAQRAQLKRIVICEDDVVIYNKASLHIVDEYLDSLNDQWDIFVGLIAHLKTDSEISKVVTFKDITFVHLNSMTSMVFNIYNHSIFQTMLSWDEADNNPKNNTIDRFLEGKTNLRIIAALPFVVKHSSDESSTLWGFENLQYAQLIENSEIHLHQKVQSWHYSRGNPVDL